MYDKLVACSFVGGQSPLGTVGGAPCFCGEKEIRENLTQVVLGSRQNPRGNAHFLAVRPDFVPCIGRAWVDRCFLAVLFLGGGGVASS